MMPAADIHDSRGHLSALGQRIRVPPITWLMSQALRRPEMVSLAAGFTDNEFLPVEEVRAVLDRILVGQDRARRALQYGPGSGDDRLRELTAARLGSLDGKGPPVDPDSVLITNGSQQFLYMAVEALCDEGDVILVEDPTYFVFLSIMQSRGILGRGVAMEPDGLCASSLECVLERLEREGMLPRVKFLYSVTYFQNPTGRTTSLERKRRALEVLRRWEPRVGHPLYYLEDVAYRELGFPEFALPPSSLALEEHRDRVILTGTYSKPFATGIRVGFASLPPSLLDVVRRIKGNHDFGTSNLLQQILAEALESGIYDRHISGTAPHYRQKGEVMNRAIAEHFPSAVRVTRAQGGLCLWASLPGRIPTGPDSSFCRQALDRGVLYVPGEYAFCSDPGRPMPLSGMRLCFGSAEPGDIETGIGLLGGVIREQYEEEIAAIV